MSSVAIFVHPQRDDAVRLGETIGSWLHARGHEVVRDTAATRPLDLVVAIGGDGTVLRAARCAAESDADIIGVNLGELGYLAEVEPEAWEDALEAYFDGRLELEERMLVAGTLDGSTVLPPALNEFVLEKQDPGRTIRLSVEIDGEFFTSYVADGLIVSSPTGSTAYSLSARGPIVAPSHRALVMTPVSPHTLFDRSLVLGPTSRVDVTVVGDRAAVLSIDGQDNGLVPIGSTISITAAPDPVRFVTRGHQKFHQILKAKFGLSDR